MYKPNKTGLLKLPRHPLVIASRIRKNEARLRQYIPIQGIRTFRISDKILNYSDGSANIGASIQ